MVKEQHLGVGDGALKWHVSQRLVRPEHEVEGVAGLLREVLGDLLDGLQVDLVPAQLDEAV